MAPYLSSRPEEMVCPSGRAFPQRDLLVWQFSDRERLARGSFQFVCLFKSRLEWGVGGDGFPSSTNYPPRLAEDIFPSITGFHF